MARAPHPERLSASDREQTHPGGDTLQTPACFSLGHDPAADRRLKHLGLRPQACRRMWMQDGPPCPRALARAGPSCHLGAPNPPPHIPHWSSTSSPCTMGREQVAEIQDGKIQSKTGKVWGPSSEKGSWSEPGILGRCGSQNQPRAPVQRCTPTTQGIPEMPQVKTASGTCTTEASQLFPPRAGTLCEPPGRIKAALPAGLSQPGQQLPCRPSHLRLPAADFDDQLRGHGLGSMRPPLNPAAVPPWLSGLEQAACPL